MKQHPNSKELSIRSKPNGTELQKWLTKRPLAMKQIQETLHLKQTNSIDSRDFPLTVL